MHLFLLDPLRRIPGSEARTCLFGKRYFVLLILIGASFFAFSQQSQDSIPVQRGTENDTVNTTVPNDTIQENAPASATAGEDVFDGNLIEGYIRDEKTGQPVADAVVVVKETSDGAMTDSEGKFALSTHHSFPLILTVTYDGTSQEVDVPSLPSEPLNISFMSAYTQDKVVVVGYGTKQRKGLTGSQVKVDPSETATIPEASVDAQMQGKAAGVQINSNTGIPGSDVFIRVRGSTSIRASNDPLYIVDGVFINSSSLQGLAQERKTSPIADINPADIESMEVLKDASATAIYGSRGANGVVIITTKRGVYDQAPRVNFSTSQGWAWAPKERVWETTTGPEHAMLVNEFNRNMGRPEPFRPVSSIINGQPGRGLPEDQPTYDRMALLNRTARLQSYDLSVSGGSKGTRYYVGGGFTKQEAIWRPLSFDRVSFKLNLDQKINKRISVGTSQSVSRSFRNQGRPANGGNGTLLQASLNIPTYLPIFLEDGTPAKWVNFDNIHLLTTTINMKSVSSHYIGNVYADADILKKIKFRTSTSLDYNLYDEEEFWDTRFILGSGGGRSSSGLSQSVTVINEQTLRYNKKLGKHNVGLLGGNTFQDNVIKSTIATGTNFPNNSYTLIEDAANQVVRQDWTKSVLVSFFARADYSFSGKYYIELTGRADGSSRFGKNNKWGYFPAVGAAWRINEEDFLSDVSWLSNLKLRASYGITGNQNGIPDFGALGQWNGGFAYPDKAGAADGPGTAPLQLANPDLRWEKTKQVNLGFEAGFWSDRLVAEINLYNKYTTDLLLDVAVPTSTGFATYLDNFGEVSNKGIELAVSSINIETRSFTWKTDFNISRNVNTVEKIPNPILFAGRDLIRLEQGKPLYSYWLYKQLYVDPQTGDAVFEDVDQDGQITGADRQIVGNTWPKFFGGLTNSFRFRNFDLGTLITFSYGNQVWNHNRMLGETGGTLDANRVLLATQLDRWTTPGQVTDVPRLTAANYARQENSRFLEDGSFLRLRSITLGYTLPKNFSKVFRLEKLRVYGQMTNLFVLTKYKGADPETNMGGDQNIQGYDYALPPMPRTVQFGLNISL